MYFNYFLLISLIWCANFAQAQEPQSVILRPFIADIFAPYDMHFNFNEPRILTPQVNEGFWVDYRGVVEVYLEAAFGNEQRQAEIPDVPLFGQPGSGASSAELYFSESVRNVGGYQRLLSSRLGSSATLEAEYAWYSEIENRSCDLFSRIYGSSKSNLLNAWGVNEDFRTSLILNNGLHSLSFRQHILREDHTYLDDINAVYGDPLRACLDRSLIERDFLSRLRVEGYFHTSIFGSFGLPLSAEVRYNQNSMTFMLMNQNSNLREGMQTVITQFSLFKKYWEFKVSLGLYNRWDMAIIALVSDDPNINLNDRLELIDGTILRTEQQLRLLVLTEGAILSFSNLLERERSTRPIGEETLVSASGPFVIMDSAAQACLAFYQQSQTVFDSYVRETVCPAIWAEDYDSVLLPEYVTLGFGPTRAAIVDQVALTLSELDIMNPEVVQEISCLLILASARSIDRNFLDEIPGDLIATAILDNAADSWWINLRPQPFDFRCIINRDYSISWSFEANIPYYLDLPMQGIDTSVGISREFETAFRAIDDQLEVMIEQSGINTSYDMYTDAIINFITTSSELRSLVDSHFAANAQFAHNLLDEYEEIYLLYDSGVVWGTLSRHYIFPEFGAGIRRLVVGEYLGKAQLFTAFRGENISREIVTVFDASTEITVLTINGQSCTTVVEEKLTQIMPDSILLRYAENLCSGTRSIAVSSDGNLEALYDFGYGLELMKMSAALYCRSQISSSFEFPLLSTPSTSERNCRNAITIKLMLEIYGSFQNSQIEYDFRIPDTTFEIPTLPNSLINIDSLRYGFRQ